MPAAHAEVGAPPGLLVHRRSVELDAYEGTGSLTVVARLTDQRPWADGARIAQVLHQMELRVVVGVPDLVITAAEAVMHDFPHSECPAIAPAFEQLVGLSVGRGYTREVQHRFGGVSGCSHLEHLARALGPMVVQAVASLRAKAVADGRASDHLSTENGGWMRNTCHIWADGGVGPQKLAIGWRPGTSTSPVPPVDQIADEHRGAAGG